MQGPDDDYLKVEQVYQYLKISRSQLYKFIEDRRFPPGIRLGGSDALVWPWLDVVAFAHLSARLAQPPPEPKRRKKSRQTETPSTGEQSK